MQRQAVKVQTQLSHFLGVFQRNPSDGLPSLKLTYLGKGKISDSNLPWALVGDMLVPWKVCFPPKRSSTVLSTIKSQKNGKLGDFGQDCCPPVSSRYVSLFLQSPMKRIETWRCTYHSNCLHPLMYNKWTYSKKCRKCMSLFVSLVHYQKLYPRTYYS